MADCEVSEAEAEGEGNQGALHAANGDAEFAAKIDHRRQVDVGRERQNGEQRRGQRNDRRGRKGERRRDGRRILAHLELQAGPAVKGN